MKTETCTKSVTSTPTMKPHFEDESLANYKLDHGQKRSPISAALSIETEVQGLEKTGLSSNDEWNSLKPAGRTDTSTKEFTDDVQIALKFGKDLQGTSFTAMVMAFITLILHNFSETQKANMDLAISQIEVIKTQMQQNIIELTAEKDSQLLRDCLTAGIEVASAVVQLAGSAVTSAKLGTKFVEQKTNSKQSELHLTNERIDKLNESVKTNEAKLTAKDTNNLAPDQKTKVETEIADNKAELDKLTTKKADLDNKLGDLPTKETIKTEGELLRTKVDLINARMQIFSGSASFIKAISPIVQGVVGSKATEHQISAKEADNAKEIANLRYQQYMNNVSSIRDGINQMINKLQEVQSQDPNNSLAVTKRIS